MQIEDTITRNIHSEMIQFGWDHVWRNQFIFHIWLTYM